MSNFMDFFWYMLWFFVWIIWIMLLFRVFVDVFRTDSSGWAKAGWVIFVVILPFLGVLVYLIAQGGNMAQREMDSAKAMESAQQDYIRNVAGSGGSADELQKLAALKDQGVISDAEFQAQKEKLLA